MLALEPQHIHMNQHAVDKTHALKCLVDILEKDGLVTPEYITDSSIVNNKARLIYTKALPFLTVLLNHVNIF